MTLQLAAMRRPLSGLGYELGQSLGGRSQGAFLATADNGTPVVLKWAADATLIDRHMALRPCLDALRARGVPIPDYLDVLELEGGTLCVQQVLSGRSQDNLTLPLVSRMVGYLASKTEIDGPRPVAGQIAWGPFVIGKLTGDDAAAGQHEVLGNAGTRCAALLERIKDVGRSAAGCAFPDGGLVHFDLHTDNILIDGDAVSGIIDWEEARPGDPYYDLVQFAFDLDGHDQPVWERVDAVGIDHGVLRAYLALLVLKCTSSAIRSRPDDLSRQLERAERVFDRYLGRAV